MILSREEEAMACGQRGPGLENCIDILVKFGKAPIGILREEVEPILFECALAIDIPMLSSFDQSSERTIQTGQLVTIDGDEVLVEEQQ